MRRTAIVHDWLATYAGAERVLEQLLQLYPKADLYCVCDFLPEKDRSFLGHRSPKTTFIQHLPAARKLFRKYLPLMPLAIERLDLSDYDVVISSSHAVAKGVLTHPDQLHVCYLQARNLKYAYEDRRLYKRSEPISFIQDALLSRIRVWDSVASRRPDVTVANSRYVARWHRRQHGIRCQVIYPPVMVELFSGKYRSDKDDYYVAVGRIEPYKRFDLVVHAFNDLGLKLKVVGDGSQFKSLRKVAKSNIEWLGYQDLNDVAEIVSRAKAFVFAGREDFGIAPVEAQAAGTPVIAYAGGGALETVRGYGFVRDRPTGILFDQQTTSSLSSAVLQFEQQAAAIQSDDCRWNAMRFSADRFRREFLLMVEEAWSEFVLHRTAERHHDNTFGQEAEDRIEQDLPPATHSSS